MIEVVSGLTLCRLPLIGGVALVELGTWYASAEAEDTRRRCADVPGERDGDRERHKARRGLARLAVEHRAVERREDPISSHLEHLAVSRARRSEHRLRGYVADYLSGSACEPPCVAALSRQHARADAGLPRSLGASDRCVRHKSADARPGLESQGVSEQRSAPYSTAG